MVGYPNKKQAKQTNTINDHHISRGMSLEDDINASNQYYRETMRALIYKKPTPIQVVRVDYPTRNKARITEAYYKTPSTTDYNGIYKGVAIDFEAKETRLKTYFPFSSIHPHQIKHLKLVNYHGGIGFFIIRFITYSETYLIDSKFVIEEYEKDDKKSLSYLEIKKHGHLIHEGYIPRINYLEVVDLLYFKEDQSDGKQK